MGGKLRFDMRIFAPTLTEMRKIECPITLESTEDGVRTPCQHYFDRQSLEEWFGNGGRGCPLCRRDCQFEDAVPLSAEEMDDLSLEDYMYIGRDLSGRTWIWIRDAAGGLYQHGRELTRAVDNNRFLGCSPLYVTLVPAVMRSTLELHHLYATNQTKAPLHHYEALTSEVAGGLVAVGGYFMAERVRCEAACDPTISPVIKMIYKGCFDLGEVAGALGGPLLAVSHLADDRETESMAGALITLGGLATTTASLTYSARRTWQEKTSAGQFVKSIAPVTLVYGLLLVMITLFNMAVLQAPGDR